MLSIKTSAPNWDTMSDYSDSLRLIDRLIVFVEKKSLYCSTTFQTLGLPSRVRGDRVTEVYTIQELNVYRETFLWDALTFIIYSILWKTKAI